METKREREWYRKFQKGTFLIKGWQPRQKEILKTLPETEKNHAGDLLEKLGEKIGKEWAKNSQERRIDTPALQKWGKRLSQSQAEGPDALMAEIRQLDRKVDDMLA
jgi:rubrerythrin